MARATVDEVYQIILDSYRGPNGSVRVHRARRMIFAGRPGHLYLMPRRPTDAQMARISNTSGKVETALIRINDAFFVKIGNRGVAQVHIFVPQRDDESVDMAITEFEWINHTHPLDMANDHQMIARGATEADRRTLELANRRFGQARSYVILCRNGRVVGDRQPFQVVRMPTLDDVRRGMQQLPR